MAKLTRQQRAIAEKHAKKRKMMESGNESNYARKKAYLDKHGLFGFQCNNKPWKKG